MQMLILANPLGPLSCLPPLEIMALRCSPGLSLFLLGNLPVGVDEEVAYWAI